jgi:hypothetical protein
VSGSGPEASSTSARQRLDQIAAEVVERIERTLPGWVEREVRRIVDAWGRLDPGTAARTVQAAGPAGRKAADRVGSALRAEMALDPARQRATPLQIVRSAYEEPTAVLAAAGIPPVERDDFHERRWPDDRYGLVPEHLSDLGDEVLGPLLLAWGMAKAAVLRSRQARHAGRPPDLETWDPET